MNIQTYIFKYSLLLIEIGTLVYIRVSKNLLVYGNNSYGGK